MPLGNYTTNARSASHPSCIPRHSPHCKSHLVLQANDRRLDSSKIIRATDKSVRCTNSRAIRICKAPRRERVESISMCCSTWRIPHAAVVMRDSFGHRRHGHVNVETRVGRKCVVLLQRVPRFICILEQDDCLEHGTEVICVLMSIYYLVNLAQQSRSQEKNTHSPHPTSGRCVFPLSSRTQRCPLLPQLI